MSEEKTIRVINFDGKVESWREYKLKFLARAKMLGYREALLGTIEVPDESENIDETTVVGKAKKKNRDANDSAYAALCLSCSGVSFGCVERSVTDKLPSGDAALAWKNLCTKYEPSTKMSIVALKKEFAECKLESVKSDPDEWYTKLEHIRVRIAGANEGQKIDDDAMMAHMLANLPRGYSELITTIEYEMESSKSTMTVDQLIDRIRNFYRRKFANLNKSGDNGEDIALVAFKGNCRKCGKQGHKANECKTKSSSDSGGNSKSDKECTYCHKKGHTEDYCWKKKKADSKAESKAESTKKNEPADIALTSYLDDVVLSAIVKEKNFFLCDSGATTHMTNSVENLTNVKEIDRSVTIGNGGSVKATKVGSMKTVLNDDKGNSVNVTFEDVIYVPELKFNLLSVGQIAKKGAAVVYDKDGAHLDLTSKNKGKVRLTSVGNGNVFGIAIDPAMQATAALEEGKSVDINKYHSMLGHVGEDATRKTAEYFGLKVVGKMPLCEPCALAKSKQKKVSKETETVTTKPGEKMYIDVSSVSATSIGGKKFMAMLVDDYSSMKWSFFLKKKSDLNDVILPKIKELKSKGIDIKRVRMDNAGENLKLGDKLKEIGVAVEYTAPNTPQQNGVVERAIATVVSRARAMISEAGLDEELKQKLWAECFNTSTNLSNIVVKDGMTPYEKFHGEGKKPRWTRHLVPFGLIGYAANRSEIKAKLDDRAYKVLFVGYSDDHEGDCYRLYKIDTQSVFMSRDVRWSEKFYCGSDSMKNETVIPTDDEVVTHEPVIVEINEIPAENPNVPVDVGADKSEGRALRSGRVIGTDLDRQLFEEYGSRGAAEVQRNVRAVEIVETENVSDLIESVDLALVSCVNSTIREPKTFAEAMASEDRDKWIEAMKTEFNNIKSKGVWRLTKKSKMKSKSSLLGTKWVYKIKSDGRYRARLVVKGYNQIPGVDFTESHSPVANDVTIRLLLVLALMYGWTCETIDVETAFLYGDLEEHVYLQIPEGYFEIVKEPFGPDDVIELLKALYELVQAARVWLNTLIKYLLSIGFVRSRADPCLLFRSGIDGFVVFLVYVDDCLICGSREGIRNCVRDIKKRFNISEMGNLSEYVGAKYIREGNKYIISQQALIDGISTLFDVENEVPTTPAISGQVLLKSTSDDILLNEQQQTVFRSGVGKLLYLTKLSRPDMSSAVRELASFMDNANMEHWKALHRALGYATFTKSRCLSLEPKKEWEGQIVGYSDSNYASNKDDRRSISGYCIYYMGALVSWKTKGQECVTMSSTEAEYVAMAACAMEMVFIKQVLESINFEVKLPMILYADNLGAISLAKNYSTGGRTKHIDIRHHYLRELISKGIIEVRFVTTDKNVADIMTKNIAMAKYDDHSDSLGMIDVPDQNREDVKM